MTKVTSVIDSNQIPAASTAATQKVAGSAALTPLSEASIRKWNAHHAINHPTGSSRGVTCWDSIKAIPIIGHLIRGIAYIIHKIAVCFFGDPVALFHTQQKALSEKLNTAPSGSLTADDLQEYREYMHLYKRLVLDNKIEQGDTVHQGIVAKIDAEWKHLRELIGFTNLGNTCWMNSVLQATFGSKRMCWQIERDLERLDLETDEQWKERKEKLEKDPPVQRPAETDALFVKRLTTFKNKFPAKRTAKIDEMINKALSEVHQRNNPVKRSSESDEEFKKRVEEHAAAAPIFAPAAEESDTEFEARTKQYGVYVARRGRDQSERQYETYMQKTIKNYLRANGVTEEDDGYVIAPLGPESDADFKIREEQHASSLERLQESDEDFGKRKLVHEALQKLLEAWEHNLPFVDLEDALEQVRRAIIDSNFDSDFKDNAEENDGAAFTRILMKVLGYELKISAGGHPVTDPGAICLPLRSSDGDDDDPLNVEEALKTYFDVRPLAHGCTHSNLKNNPDIIPLHFGRRTMVGSPTDPQVATEIQKILKSRLSEINKLLSSRHSQEREKGVIEAFVNGILQAENMKINRPVEFPASDVIRTPILGGAMFEDYKVVSFTVHKGSYSGGHYVAYRLCDDGKWRCYNDSVVTEVNDKERREAMAQAYNVILEQV